MNSTKHLLYIAYQWHFYHLIRLFIAAVGMVALTLSLLVDKAKH